MDNERCKKYRRPNIGTGRLSKEVKKTAIIFLVLVFLVIIAYFVSDQWLKPSIELIKISSDSIVSMKDTLSIVLKFEDRSGEIGDSVKSSSKVFIEDTAYNVV